MSLISLVCLEDLLLILQVLLVGILMVHHHQIPRFCSLVLVSFLELLLLVLQHLQQVLETDLDELLSIFSKGLLLRDLAKLVFFLLQCLLVFQQVHQDTDLDEMP